jgi:hypothetical protein
MVRNEREYRISKAQVEEFELAVVVVVELSDADVHPLLLQAQRDSLQSQLTELREELAEYESYRRTK